MKSTFMNFYKARLKTGRITVMDLKKRAARLKVPAKMILTALKAFQMIDGKEVILTDSFFCDGYLLASWSDEDKETFMEFVYLLEQDPETGRYIDNREDFIEDWENGNYNPNTFMGFNPDEVEILEKFN